LPAGKRPSFDHSKRVVLLNGRNGRISLALPMPVVGSCIAGLFAVVGSVSFEVLSVKGITGVFWVACCFVILTAPYRIGCIAAVFCDMNSLEGGLICSTPNGVLSCPRWGAIWLCKSEYL